MIDVEDFKILTRGVEDFHDVRVFEQLHQRIKRQTISQRIDQYCTVIVIIRIGDLHQTQFGIIGPFAQKFGIHCNIGMFFRAMTKRSEVVGPCNDLHRGLYFSISARVVLATLAESTPAAKRLIKSRF